MYSDESLIVTLGMIYMFVCTIAFNGFSTMDYKITGGQKIQIDNAVYTCYKIQELNLK
jgi:hypothetical protein